MKDPGDETPAGRSVRRVLLLSGCAGFAIGLLHPSWQVAVEPAQVLAGLVRYPDGNPFYLYETRVWNVWHQLLAPLLRAGVTELALSVAISGALGALVFQALALFALALGAQVALACAIPFLVVFLNPLGWGFSYPILLVGHPHTYGMAGLAWVMLVCGVLGAGRLRAGALLLGLAPAFHAVLGAWLAVVVGLALLAELRAFAAVLPALLRWGVVGAALAGASLLAHELAPRLEVHVAPEVQREYFEAFLRLWDYHRQTPDLAAWNGWLVWTGLCLCFAWLRHLRPPLPIPQRLLLRVYLLSGAVPIALLALQRLGSMQALPDALLVAMPARLLNLCALAWVPLVLGILWRFRRDVRALSLLALLGCVLLSWRSDLVLAMRILPFVGLASLGVVARHGSVWGAWRAGLVGTLGYLALCVAWRGRVAWQGDGGFPMAALAAGAFVLAGFAIQRQRVSPAKDAPTRVGARAALRSLAARLEAPAAQLLLLMPLVAASALAAADGVARAAMPFSQRLAEMRDRTNDPVLAAASRAPGLIAPGSGIAHTQLLTRRPVLLDPEALDMLPYAPEGGPELRRILEQFYGIDFFRPPRAALHSAVLPEQPVRHVWERRGEERWRELGALFGVSHVLVRSGWTLRLPEAARGPRLVLYAIPAARAGDAPSGDGTPDAGAARPPPTTGGG